MKGAVKKVCPYRFQVEGNGNNNNDDKYNYQVLPYCGDEDIWDGAVHDGVERILIVLHGFKRDAYDYYDHGVMARKLAIKQAKKQGGYYQDGSTLVIAPQFLKEKDLDKHSLSDYHLFWTSVKWNQGHKSVKYSNQRGTERFRPFRVSSFEVMNQMLEALDDQDSFPNLQSVVLFGHGAGSQFVQRYAAGGTVELQTASLTYVVGNPGTQFYLSDARAVPGSLNQFETPSENILEECSEYNDYKFGTDNMNAYMDNIGADQLQANYVDRQVYQMLGELDNNDGHHLDKTCSGMLQGRFRRERGVIFHNYLLATFGSDVVGHHGFYFIKGSGHENDKMMRSSCGLHLLFGVGTLENACSKTMSASLLRYWTCQGCKRNIFVGLLGTMLMIVAAFAPHLWRRYRYHRRTTTSSPPLMHTNDQGVIA